MGEGLGGGGFPFFETRPAEVNYPLVYTQAVPNLVYQKYKRNLEYSLANLNHFSCNRITLILLPTRVVTQYQP